MVIDRFATIDDSELKAPTVEVPHREDTTPLGSGETGQGDVTEGGFAMADPEEEVALWGRLYRQ